MIFRRIAVAFALVLALCLGWWLRRSAAAHPAGSAPAASPQVAKGPADAQADGAANGELAPTLVYAHNLLLHKGPDFRIYIRWIRGEMVRTHRGVNPSFDDPESFVLEVQKGVIRANIGDISNFLNTSAAAKAPLTGISIQPDGERLKLHGVVHKLVPLPVSLTGTLSATADSRVRFHVEKIDVLKVPLKGLLGGFHVQLADMVPGGGLPGMEIAGNDILFDTQKLLPPPHIHGRITAVRVRVPDLEVIYGDAGNDDSRLAQWHNFLRLSGGTLDFGKLTMHHADLTMVDASKDPWFDLDLVNYQAQLVNGYTRMTAQAGLEIFMPDLDEQAPKKAAQGITMEWLKNRNRSLPADVPVR